MALNSQLPLQALVRDAAGELVPDASVTWTVENGDIASVSPAGVLTGLALGTTQVAASARGKSGIATVTVTRTPVASVVVRPNSAHAVIGSKTQLIATTYDAGPERTHRTWNHLDHQQRRRRHRGWERTRDRKGGRFRRRSRRRARARATSASSTSSLLPVATVSIAAGATSIAQNATTTLVATTKDANGSVLTGRPITWRTSDESIVGLSATSGSSVQITGGMTGKATITATSEGVTSQPSSISVSNGQVARVVVTLAANPISPNSTTTATAVVYDAGERRLQGRTVSWFASGAATVSPSTERDVGGRELRRDDDGEGEELLAEPEPPPSARQSRAGAGRRP